MDLIDYYNHIFLNQIDEIISNEEQARKILDTPIRIRRKEKISMDLEMTPMNSKYRQVPIGAFGSKKTKFNHEEDKGNQYKSGYILSLFRLVKSLKGLNLKEEENENDVEEAPSPRFGCSLNRSISFGDINQKF